MEAFSLFDGPLRAQAAFTAETLRQLNAPIVDALARQRELADKLAAAAAQIAAMAEQVEALSRQHAEVSEAMRAALEPYLRYVDWLGQVGSGSGETKP
jgi:Spy/CpxP family protein refolding chaperone